MPLNIGARLGPYEVIAQIGAGGMGEVYRARDTKLNRDVAIKVLPDLFASDPDRLARFTREAQTLASLNHLHIAHIYGLDRQDGRDGQERTAGPATSFIVMELVEGEDLSQRVARGAIPLDEALPIAKQIAEALEAAHEQGIMHRDLKPANIKVREDGTVKVLDFGLAKLAQASDSGLQASRDLTQAPTLTPPAMMTGMGVILGTAAYMSPEQAKGRPADKRSDIWAFGCVLYEMLTGQRAFGGEDVSDTIAAVLRGEPDWSALPPKLPPAIDLLVRGCLEKDRKKRIADTSIAHFLMDERATAALVGPAVAQPARRAWKQVVPLLLAAALAGAVIAGIVVWNVRPSVPASPPAVARFSFILPEGQIFTNIGRHVVAISPDGAQMLYVANTRLYLRSMSQLEARAIPGTETQGAVSSPVFSPDGLSIAFWSGADQTLKRIGVVGGAAVTLCKADQPYGMSWSTDGILVGQGPKGIMRVSPNGGPPETVVSVKSGELAHGPQMLPDGRTVLFTLATGTDFDRWDKARIVAQLVKSSERKILIEGGSDARYLPTGHLVYALGGVLFAVPFDPQRLQVAGGPVPIVEGVSRGQNTGAAQLGVSTTGSLIYVPGSGSISAGMGDIALMDRKGGLEPLKLPPGTYQFPRVSPDGKRIAFGTTDAKEAIVWVYDLAGTKAMSRLTFGGHNRYPVWSADGQRVAFQSDREGDLAIFWQRADGTGTPERLTKPEQGASHVPESWSPKDDIFLFSITKGSDVTLWTFSLRDKKTTAFGAVRSSTPTTAVFSPDARWIAYHSDESGSENVYVQPFPATGAKYQLFAKAGDIPHHPLWSPDGKELLYIPRAGEFEAVSVTTQPTFAFGRPVPVPRPSGLNLPGTVPRTDDIMPDGRVVWVVASGQTQTGVPAAPQIHVVLNWTEELKRRAPVK